MDFTTLTEGIIIYLMICLRDGCTGWQSPIRVCPGTTNIYEELVINPRSAYVTLFKRYAGCTHITNHLILSYLKEDDDLTFLSSIVEVNGTVIITRNTLSVIPLPNLRLIRGQVCKKIRARNFSLIIVANRSPSRNRAAYLDFHSLKAVARCDITISWNRQLCYRINIGFHRMLVDNETQRSLFSRRREGFNCPVEETCSSSCLVLRSRRRCWGPNSTRCLPAVRYSGQCHAECLYGCSGPADTECSSCRHFQDGGRCVESCPTQKFLFFSKCLQVCPRRYLKSGRNCVMNCPHDSYPYNENCVPCSGSQCNRVCRLHEWAAPLLTTKPRILGYIVFLDGTVIFTPRTFLNKIGRRGCDILDGDLNINSAAAIDLGFNEFIRERDLDNLKMVKHINGFVYLDLNRFPGLRNLSFLANLTTINTPKHFKGLEIYHSRLKRLSLNKLESVNASIVSIFNNTQLCITSLRNRRFATEAFYVRQFCGVGRAACMEKGCW